MKQLMRWLFIVVLVAVSSLWADTPCHVSGAHGKTYWRGRSAAQNSALQMVGVAQYMHRANKECQQYGVASISFGFESSTHADSLGRNFAFSCTGDTVFGPDARLSTTNFSAGDVAPNNGTNARNIDFGLSPSFESVVTFAPTIKKGLLNFDWFMGLDQFVEDLWIRAYAPLVWAEYAINPCEKTRNGGGQLYAPGFVSLSADAVDVPHHSAVAAWSSLDGYGEIGGSGCGKIKCESDSIYKVGALQLDLGYDAFRCERGHFGVGVHGVIGTANTPRATYLFPAIAGSINNELGGVIDAAWTTWRCDDRSFTFYAYGVFSHLFAARQTRLLGLTVGGDQQAGSSWLLLKQFDDTGLYTGKVINAANCLGRNVSVGNNLMADVSVMAQMHSRCLDIAVGYNYYYISGDKRQKCQTDSSCLNACYCNLSEFNYGIKGVARVGKLAAPTTADVQFFDRFDSNIAESGSIENGTTVVIDATPLFITESEVTDKPALSPSGHSHKVFFFIEYSDKWGETEPFVGVGGSYESAVTNTLATQWGIYFKGGLAF